MQLDGGQPSWQCPHGTKSQVSHSRGPLDGWLDGVPLGSEDGELLADTEGDALGALLGNADGDADGSDVGCVDGALLG